MFTDDDLIDAIVEQLGPAFAGCPKTGSAAPPVDVAEGDAAAG